MKLKRRVLDLEQQLTQQTDSNSALRDDNTALEMDKKQLESGLVEYKQRMTVRFRVITLSKLFTLMVLRSTQPSIPPG